MTRNSPLEVIRLETWEHAEHTNSIVISEGKRIEDGGASDFFDETIMQFRDRPTQCGDITRRHRAHVAAGAPELARALQKLMTAVTTFPGGFEDRQIAEALSDGVKVLQKIGAMVKA